MKDRLGVVGKLADADLQGRLSELRGVENYAAAMVLLGVANWVTMSVFNFDAVQAVAGRKSISTRAAYGLIGVSGIYAAIRGARRAG